MRALVWHGRGDVRVEEIADAPAPRPGELRVRVDWCGICGSDVHEYRDGPFQIPLAPHPVTGMHAPIVLGHEVAGRVERVGEGVTHLAAGQLVALDGLIPCGRCDQCRAGAGNRCRTLGHIGMSAHGGLAEAITVPAAMALAAPDGMPADVAALAEPFAVAVRCLRRARLDTGARVLVLGAGAIGLAVALLARARGCDVIVADVAPPRREHARQLGFAVSADVGDLARPDEQAEVAFDCTGGAAGPALAVGATRPGGRVVLAGLPPSTTELDVVDVVLREVTLLGAVGHLAATDTRDALAALADERLGASRVVTRRIALEHALDEGLDRLAGPPAGEDAKILVAISPAARRAAAASSAPPG